MGTVARVMDADQLFAMCFAPDPARLFNDAKTLLRSHATWERGCMLLDSAARGGSYIAAVWYCSATLPTVALADELLAPGVAARDPLSLASKCVLVDGAYPAAAIAELELAKGESTEYAVALALLQSRLHVPLWGPLRALAVEDTLAATFAIDERGLDSTTLMTLAEKGAAAGFLNCKRALGRELMRNALRNNPQDALTDASYRRGLRLCQFVAQRNENCAAVFARDAYDSPHGDWGEGWPKWWKTSLGSHNAHQPLLCCRGFSFRVRDVRCCASLLLASVRSIQRPKTSQVPIAPR